MSPRGIEALHATRPQHPPTPPGCEARSLESGVFLHTGWRSGGTWLWSRCRRVAGVRALYEPLHESIGGLRRADIPRISPDSWRSRHDRTEPYFAEYGKLIPNRGAGVPLYLPRFAFDGFFLEVDQEDAALEAYLRGLLCADGSAGHPAALKFCRSLGRVPWFERVFPDYLHAVVLRHPQAQFRSAQRLLAQERNRYFTVAPMLVLARNQRHALVDEACAALGVRLPELGSTDMAYGVETIWRHVKRQDEAARYRGFLAFWAVTTLTALRGNAMVIDTGLLANSQEHRDLVASALGRRLSGPVDLASQHTGQEQPPGPDMAHAQRDATAFILAHAGNLTPPRLATLLDFLAVPGAPVRVRQPGPPARIAVDRAGGTPGFWKRARIAGLVAMARALQPIRRLHGKLTQRRKSFLL